MKILYIDAAFREGSRTRRLAEAYLKTCKGEITTVKLGSGAPLPLNEERLVAYNNAVGSHDFADPMFDSAKCFREADEIVIAAPFWNYTVPAVLHDYLEMVCSQGVTFDMNSEGQYFTLCKAKKLTFLITAGGPIPENDHAFGYIKTLAQEFWGIDDIQYFKADCLDIYGVDVEKELGKVFSEING